MRQLAKLIENGLLKSICIPYNNEQMFNEALEDGYMEHEIENNDTELEQYQTLKLKHRQEDNKIVSYYDVVSNDPILIQRKIDELTTKLSATDYKVVKNHEYIDAGLEPYYNPTELYNEREPLRQQIRELETLLET